MREPKRTDEDIVYFAEYMYRIKMEIERQKPKGLDLNSMEYYMVHAASEPAQLAGRLALLNDYSVISLQEHDMLYPFMAWTQ